MTETLIHYTKQGELRAGTVETKHSRPVYKIIALRLFRHEWMRHIFPLFYSSIFSIFYFSFSFFFQGLLGHINRITAKLASLEIWSIRADNYAKTSSILSIRKEYDLCEFDHNGKRDAKECIKESRCKFAWSSQDPHLHSQRTTKHRQSHKKLQYNIIMMPAWSN